MTARVLNLLWLNLKVPAPPDPEDGSIVSPMPAHYIEKAQAAALRFSETQVDLWVDSKRLTEKQRGYLETAVAPARLRDLREIPEFNEDYLYQRSETNFNWRNSAQKNTVIWLQVDCAKVLISLQGDADRTFFADLDHALDVDIENSPEVEKKFDEFGLFVGRPEGFRRVENQMWGFTRERREFFERYYKWALEDAHNGQNAYEALHSLLDRDIYKKSILGPPPPEPDPAAVTTTKGDGTQAEHSGEKIAPAPKPPSPA